LQSPLTLNVVGYLVAFAIPPVALVVVIQVLRRYPRVRWPAGIAALIALGAVITGLGDALAELAATMATGLLPQLPMMSIILLFTGIGVAWVAVGIGAAAESANLSRATDWVVRHRRPFTIVAACCPLPYALLRLTWLTPWPLLGGEGLELPVRIWGLLLSVGAWVGATLTLGLIRPWGEVFPRWVPVLALRRVPIAAAVVPGGLVAAVLCFTALPWLYAAGSNLPEPHVDPALRVVAAAVVFPCWLWGPSLALAVWGYAGRRRAAVAGQAARSAQHGRSPAIRARRADGRG
jgi:hypothetical protein